MMKYLLAPLGIGALAAATALFSPAWAEESQKPQIEPEPFVDFTFKRVKAPQSRAQKRITVQIKPEAAPKPAAVPTAAKPSAPGSLPYDWFWSALDPKAGKDPARAQRAVDMIEANLGQVPEPRLQTLQSAARSYGRDLLLHSIGKDVSPAFALAVMTVESAGDAQAISRAGAQGLMQLMPKTAESYGVDDAMNPTDNIRGGIAMLHDLMRAYDHDPVLALAAYNAGAGAVRDHGGVPPFPETRAYVPKVMAAWRVARGLCVTPPELVTDGCVFAVANGS